MKAKQRILAWLAVAALLVAALPLSAAAEEAVPRYGRGILAQMANADALLYVYDTIADGVDRAEATIDLHHDTHRVTWNEVTTVFDLIQRDYPEYFWLVGESTGAIVNGYAVSITPAYHMTGDDLAAARGALDAQVAALTADLAGKSDYDKSILLHDRVAAAVSYVSNGMDQTAYGALVGGRAVCAGYARAYQLLLNAVGIPAWYVTGYSVNPATGKPEAHGWDLVQLDGEWYYTDVTWDDQVAYTFYAYLNVTEAVITADHVITAYNAYLPAATSTAHNYFYRNDLVFDTFDVQRVVEVFRTYPTARFCVTYDHREFWAAYSENIMTVIEELGFPAGHDIYFGQWELGQEMILTLTTEHDCLFEPVTVEPTCGADGYTVEECAYDFCHNQRNYTVLPATGDHVYDHDYDPDCNVCGAVREVAPPSDNAAGDLNGDAAVNNRDLVLLIRYASGWEIEADLYAADCDGDGTVTVKDAALLQQYVNGWPVDMR